MAYLIDTNVLLRRARPGDPQHGVARLAIRRLKRRGEDLYINSQNVIEFWNALTRPADRNGFGMTPAQADAEAGRLEQFFRFAADTPDIHHHWRQLVATVGVSGVQVPDDRLVAVMLAHGISHLLTFNVEDFKRYSDITAVHPANV
ncbi:MAG: type II toxin-antitoxin system VapC family toxin [Acidobacteria bacterium]|nr:type II toxin-antitoxin system VapC family toxin [Acidobacteriota bacterium]MCW5967725.1 type II toxin-antitoxin system VapC family toxin [Blastocatellales bacterium]